MGFATLGRVCRLLGVQIPRKTEGGRDGRKSEVQREKRREHEDGKYRRGWNKDTDIDFERVRDAVESDNDYKPNAVQLY